MVKQFNYVHFVTNVGGWHRPHLPPWPPPQRCRCRSAGAGGGGIPNPIAAVILGWPRGHGAGGSTDGGTTVAEYNWGGRWDGGGGVSDGSRGSGGRARGGCAPREATRHATAGLRPPDCRCPGGWGDGDVAAAVDVLLLTLPATTAATTAVVAAAPTVAGVRRAPQAGSVGAPLTAASALAAPPQVSIYRCERRSIRKLLPTRGNYINT